MTGEETSKTKTMVLDVLYAGLLALCVGLVCGTILCMDALLISKQFSPEEALRVVLR